MADRNINFDPTVTQVTQEKPDLGLLTGTAEFADNIAQMSANAKALNATTQTALAFRQADAQFRQDAAGNPQDPEALAKLQQTRAQIVSQIGQQVPAIASREYMQHMMEVQQNSDKLNELWGMQQSVRNAHADLENSAQTQYKIATDAGRQFGASGGDMANIASVLNFEQAQQAVSKFAGPVLGAPVTTNYLNSTFNPNYVKSFISGLAENHPEMAAIALQQPNIRQNFTDAQIDDMANLIKKTQKQQQLLQNFITTKNDGSLINVLNDTNSGYNEKRLKIEQGMANGSVSSSSGKAALNVLHSQQTVDAITDAPVMKNILDQVSAINANEKFNKDDYLLAAKDIHTQILQQMSNGNLTQDDAAKLTDTVNKSTASKMSDATNQVRNELGSAATKFDALPLQYRAQAVQQLFYAYHGHENDFNQTTLNNRASSIVDSINAQRRRDALQTVNGAALNDTAFLKSINATPADVQETASKHGISPQQVILRLRTEAAQKARMEKHKVTKIAREPAEEDTETATPTSQSKETPADDTDTSLQEQME